MGILAASPGILGREHGIVTARTESSASRARRTGHRDIPDRLRMFRLLPGA